MTPDPSNDKPAPRESSGPQPAIVFVQQVPPPPPVAPAEPEKKGWAKLLHKAGENLATGLLALFLTGLVTLSAQLQGTRENVATLQGQTGALVENVKELRSGLDAVRADVGVLKQDVAVIKSQLAEMKGRSDERHAELKAQFAELKALIAAPKGRP